jgi:hypothetical protein
MLPHQYALQTIDPRLFIVPHASKVASVAQTHLKAKLPRASLASSHAYE